VQNEKGIETLKGGITLASKVMVEGYYHYERWDIRGTVRTAIRRCAFYLTKGWRKKKIRRNFRDKFLSYALGGWVNFCFANDVAVEGLKKNPRL
jgi:hypothetical protein